MAALEAATQQARIRARKDVLAIADAIALGARLKGGHDEL
jgi:hypothetical protein